MKRNFSLIVLTFEITAIVILHAVKMNQAQPTTHDMGAALLKTKISAPAVKNYPLLSIK